MTSSTAVHGRRLSPQQRRAQLVEIGVRLVAASSFDDVSVDQVAAEAGISRSLLFHYFANKREFQVAVAQAAADELLAATAPDDTLPVDERLRLGLEAYVDYVATRGEAFLSLVRGASGGDPALQAVFDHAHEAFAERILEGLGITAPPPLLHVAVRGWVAFAEEAIVVWLPNRRVSQTELVELLERTLVGAVAATGPPYADLLQASPPRRA